MDSGRALSVGEEVPDFTANTQKGEINFHDFITGSWCLFFSHPANFTPVCTTEFGMVSKLRNEFKARNCEILGLSIDSVEAHEAWIKDINETQETEVDFPIVADETAEVADKFGMCGVQEDRSQRKTINVRTLYIIDPNRKVQLHMTYPSNVGRNFYEIIRILDALQLTTYYQVGTPANWKAGEDLFILPSVSEGEAQKKFPRGFTEIKPYMRLTPAPDLAEAPLHT